MNEAEKASLRAQLAAIASKLNAADAVEVVRPATPSTSRLAWVWLPELGSWAMAVVTHIYPPDAFGENAALNKAHEGYVDATVFPRGEAPRYVSSIKPADYSWCDPSAGVL